MSYITYDELIARYAALGTSSASNVNSDLIYYASIEINGLLGSHFTVPFTANHPTIKDLTIDLAYYKNLRGKDPEKAEKLRESIMDRIESIKSGEEAIYTGSGTLEMSSTPNADIWSSTQDYHPVHSMLDADDPLTVVCSEQLYDEANERI